MFECEARFSKKTPVPMLGVYEDGKVQVEGFYDFWYNFDSWRSFEYLDKEVNEGSDKYVPFPFPLSISHFDLMGYVVVMTNDIPKRRIRPNVQEGRRKIPPVFVHLLI